MTRVNWKCPRCRTQRDDNAEVMGLPLECECGAIVIAPVDWTDLQGFVMIFAILYPICALFVKQEWWNWLKWVGLVGIAFLAILIFEALPKEGHESSVTSLLRGQVVGAVVLAFTGLTSLFYVEAQGLMPALDFLSEFSDAPSVFSFYLVLDVIGLGWFGRLIFNFPLHRYAMITYPMFYGPPITMSAATALFVQTSHIVPKIIGLILIGLSVFAMLRPHAIRPVLLSDREQN